MSKPQCGVNPAPETRKRPPPPGSRQCRARTPSGASPRYEAAESSARFGASWTRVWAGDIVAQSSRPDPVPDYAKLGQGAGRGSRSPLDQVACFLETAVYSRHFSGNRAKLRFHFHRYSPSNTALAQGKGGRGEIRQNSMNGQHYNVRYHYVKTALRRKPCAGNAEKPVTAAQAAVTGAVAGTSPRATKPRRRLPGSAPVGPGFGPAIPWPP